MWQTTRNRLVEHPMLDYLGAGCFTVIHLVLAWRTDRFDPLRTAGFDTRLGLYTDLITVTGIFVGFSGAALASYLAFSGDRIEALRKRVGAKITRQWLSAITGPSAAVGVLLLVKTFDRPESVASWVRWLAEAASLFIAVRVARMLYVYAQLVWIATTPPERKVKKRSDPIAVRPR